MISSFKRLLYFILLSSAIQAWAKKEILIIGGGGEPAGETTIFDDSVRNLGKLSKSAGWTPTVVFNGGHRQSEGIAKDVGGSKTYSGTLANIDKQLALLKQKIQNGTLKKGDQLMIAVNTHGADKRGNELTHSVAAKDGLFNVDRLKEVRDLAEKKGVQLAILDNSCYSGYTIKLGTDKTCVMSAASTNVGYSNAASMLTWNMRPGLNLEEVFFGARLSKQGISPGTPQISTPAGLKTFQATQFLYQSMLERYSLNLHLKNSTQDNCNLKSKDYLKLTKELKEIEKHQFTLVRDLVGMSDAAEARQELESAIKNYEIQRNKARALFEEKTKLNPSLCLELAASSGSNRKKVCATLERFGDAYDRVQSRLKKSGNAPLSPQEKDELQVYEKVVQSPGYKKYLKAEADYDEQINTVYRTAAEVGKAERKVYEALYIHYQKESKASNPCRSFIL